MTDFDSSSSPTINDKIYRLFREFFARSERKRRWKVDDDIPWDQCNRSLDPTIADVVESFCAIEMYLPDYVGMMMPHIRAQRGRAWFTFNWGYEEAKHSLALGDWLLKSGFRSEEQMQDLEGLVFENTWQLPMDSVRGMLCYSMSQELATWLHYRNLREKIGPHGDPALYTLLNYVAIDERAHYNFFMNVVKFHLEEDRPGTLEQLKRVLNGFMMPAVTMLADGPQRIAAVAKLDIFDLDKFYRDVYLPILEDLGVERSEMRNRTATRKSLSSNSGV